jgi:hypothetical protein
MLAQMDWSTPIQNREQVASSHFYNVKRMNAESFQSNDALPATTDSTDSCKMKLTVDNENNCIDPRNELSTPHTHLPDTNIAEGKCFRDYEENEMYQTPTSSHYFSSCQSSTLKDLFRRIGPVSERIDPSAQINTSRSTDDAILLASSCSKSINTPCTRGIYHDVNEKLFDAPRVPSSTIESTITSSVHRILPPMFTPIRANRKARRGFTVPIIVKPKFKTGKDEYESNEPHLCQQEQPEKDRSSTLYNHKWLYLDPPVLPRKDLEYGVSFLEDNVSLNPLPTLPTMDEQLSTLTSDTSSEESFHRKLKMRRTSAFSSSNDTPGTSVF